MTNEVYRDINVLGYGAGVNTWALLLEATKIGLIFDFILFSDTGGERQKTYQHLNYANAWCLANGQPKITILKKRDKNGRIMNLYDDSLSRADLPSKVFGYSKCSLKFKKGPADVFCNNNPLIRSCWKNGYKVNKYLGFDADEGHRTEIDYSDKKYSYQYPLVDWDWGRFECIKCILDAGEPLPPKSSCTYCPSMKPWEIIELYLTDRPAFYAAVELERVAKPNMIEIQGLGRHWSWWDVIVAYRYFQFYIKNPFGKKINKRIIKMVKRVQRSKPERLRPMIQKAKSPEQLVCDIFRNSIEACAHCMT